MGKNKNKHLNTGNDILQTSVSLVTVTQVKKKPFWDMMVKLVQAQDYKNIIEWVIVDGTPEKTDETTKTFNDYFNNLNISEKVKDIVLINSTKANIGGFRNDYNKVVKGDIIVCIDDDDYYPPCRVSHAVEKLTKSSKLIAGFSPIYLYDIELEKIYQSNIFMQNHSVNTAMAYKKEYLEKHTYNEVVKLGEEQSFTNNFTEPMEQLDGFKTVLQVGHNLNTFDKKSIIFQSYYVKDPKGKSLLDTNYKLKDFIKDKDILQETLNIYNSICPIEDDTFDIVYYCGIHSILWSPKQKDLGGSEQAVVNLSKQWADKKYSVCVYGNLSFEGDFQGVVYKKWNHFRIRNKYKNLVLWRAVGTFPLIEFPIRADNIIVDLHDNIPEVYGMIDKKKDKINKVLVKSNFHKMCFSHFTGKKDKDIDYVVPIMNGVRVGNFSIVPDDVKRNPFRVCYCSCYTRGLENILRNLWPLIYELEPRAELHVYYGMEQVKDQHFINNMKMLLSQKGVMEHGRQGIDLINREKHLSTFHLYYTDSLAEIDCISIRESLVANCIPILANVNLFCEREGIKFEWKPDITKDGFNKTMAINIVMLMRHKEKQEELRDMYSKSKTIVDWSDVADEWIKNGFMK